MPLNHQSPNVMNPGKSFLSITVLNFTVLGALQLAGGLSCLAQPDPNWLDHDRNRPQPPVVTPATPSTQEQAGKPPSDATVLFDGKDLSQWCSLDGSPTKWIMRDGYMECVKGSGYVRTKENFGDCQLHVEWATPVPPHGEGQGRGNSGVFFGLDRYEVQVLDSYENKTYADGRPAPSMANTRRWRTSACRPANGRPMTSSIPRRALTPRASCFRPCARPCSRTGCSSRTTWS